ncbi:transposase family protein [Streptomyces sp. NBC_00285]|uniref:transposase family protein n=1 Tax=Streptomyces sp. NBC_00285 TaxID=2975700 RepID=UPI003FA6BEFD
MEASRDLLQITARTWDGAAAVCPACGTESDRVHSRYVGHVAGEAVGGRAVVIDLSVRRLYCENSGCPKTPVVGQALDWVTELRRTHVQKVVVVVVNRVSPVRAPPSAFSRPWADRVRSAGRPRCPGR